MESLEPRHLMAASALVEFGPNQGGGQPDPVITSFDNSSVLGALQTLQAEAWWQARMAAAHGNNTLPAPLSIPTDPYLANQWHLINTGQQVNGPDFQPIFAVPGEDINVAPAWNMGYTGAGVVVAVVDSGVQKNHPDLAANIHPTLELDALSLDGDASPRTQVPAPGWEDDFFLLYDGSNAHGTAVAGLIGAAANGIGGTGVAPGVQIVPIRYIDPLAPDRVQSDIQSFVDVFRYATNEIDITNNSWGPGARAPFPMAQQELFAIRDSIFFGRDGKGVIHIFASGNSGEEFGDSNYYQPHSLRYTLSVTGVDHDGFYNNVDGTYTSYPEVGSSVFVAAPTGSVFQTINYDELSIGSGLLTTDLTGTGSSGQGGFNIAPDPVNGQEYDRDFLTDTTYTSKFNGTSGAAPIAAGVAALMLEANPNLTWRDVQEIMIRSARQNAQFDIPQLGFNQGNGFGATQNTWIINQMPAFHEPDFFDPTISPVLQTLFPTLQFNLQSDHYQPTPSVLTSGAGYTISQGRGANGELTGYAHGVVDATLAVQLAEQWHEKKQNLPRELTFTTSIIGGGTVPAAEQLDNTLLIPGGLRGQAGFSEYWAWYFDPEGDQPPNTRGGPIQFFVPDNNAMTVESVEVRVSISGGAAAALDNVRMLLVSPEGTHSELNNFYVDPGFQPYVLQNETPYTVAETPGSFVDGDTLVWSFNTNRSWGERSDAAFVIDPSTGEVQFDAEGLPIEKGWTLHFENYGATEISIDDIEFVWHGSPIAANTQRVMGFVGVDENQDDLFNFSRIIAGEVDIDGDPNTLRYGEIVNEVDLTQEKFGSNVTVTVRRESDLAVVEQFVTGADGNFYFDLIPGNYIISVDDPLGRTAVDDSLTAPGFLQQYKTEWRITEDWFRLWDYDANLRVPIDPATDAPFSLIPPSFFDPSLRVPVEAGIKNLNFLLDPGAPSANEVAFSGVVFADINGDGTFNGDDYFVPNVSVFGDINQNGFFDAGEELTITNADGSYDLIVPLEFSTVMNVGILPPAGWTPTEPDGGLQPYFVQPGLAFSGVDFGMLPPPSGNPGDPSSTLPGLITGLVFDDVNKDGIRQTNEAGLGGVRVYIDTNNSGSFDGGDIDVITNSNGAYVFSNIVPGRYFVRVETPAPLVQTRPVLNLPYQVTLFGGGTITGLQFGVNNPALFDYGSLPAPYATRLADDGARHTKSAYYLGRLVDAEIDARTLDNPSFPLGDNSVGFDEDGIVVDPLVAGATGRLVADASRHGGYLQGWMDFNADGDFDDEGERIITNKLLVPGLNEVFFQVAAAIEGDTVYARFRYGEYGINSVTGAAQIGEVEDYALPYAPAVITTEPAGPLTGDFNLNGAIDGFDFLAWQRNFGMESAQLTDGDGDGDGAVGDVDGMIWEVMFGQATGVPVASGPYALPSSLSVAPQVVAAPISTPNAARQSSGVELAGAAQRSLERPTTRLRDWQISPVAAVIDQVLESQSQSTAQRQAARPDWSPQRSTRTADERVDFGIAQDVDEAFAELAESLFD